MRQEMVQTILSGLNGSSADIDALAIISLDGLTIASALSSRMDEDRVGAMAGAMLSLGDRTASELERGTLEQDYDQGGQRPCPVDSRRARSGSLREHSQRSETGPGIS